ncbi:ARPP-1 family domain-containing protein [Candidatus Chrysopegis kryptomonas]|uniref:ARG and Rhodanese-Phosphatase-superfamily-associated domain-containing protein n=1 Tax=Candidatus Chryseopegocella kryptomonas TaxID=1633643 RepID=A0A0P1P0G2_9BACT|nr:DUF6569 family protein [Candidatus Chrysopegis kryptomonas]CUT04997.1 hypothetical protein JGI23_01858 [Candidatus Chrysopegis kryptomonas]
MLKIDFFNQVRIGEPKSYENMTVYPIFALNDGNVKYLTLAEALSKKLVKITEVSESGVVNELKVENFADVPILMLDGEELVGAKQNRTLNTTVLIKEKSTTFIPVSCVEQGRWSYRSREFVKHKFMVPFKLRAKKAASVTESIKSSGRFYAHQGMVWEEVAFFISSAGASSNTFAIDDAYNVIEERRSDYFNAFRYEDGQNGIIVLIDGVIVGVDYVSLKNAYKIYHDGLIAGYILSAISEKRIRKGYETIEDLINDFKNYKWESVKSVGLGDDVRFKNNNYTCAGLIYQDEIIHLAILNLTSDEFLTRRSRGGYLWF